MKVLVTGGPVFIGSHLVRRLLRAGHAAVIVDNFNDYYNPAIKRSNIAGLEGHAELVEANIEDADRMKQVVVDGKFDAIVHIAARAGVRPSVENPLSYLQTNVNGTYNMLDAAKGVGWASFYLPPAHRFMVWRRRCPSRRTSRSRRPQPYAATKLAGEHLCGNFSHLYGLGVVCLRFFTVTAGATSRPRNPQVHGPHLQR